MYHLQWLEPPQAVHLAWNLLQHVKKHAGSLEKELRCLQEGRYTKNEAQGDWQEPVEGRQVLRGIIIIGLHLTVFLNEDNNSGFTVIDVTNPFSPSYCFSGKHRGYGFKPGYPIDPKSYALRYDMEPPGDELSFEYLKEEVQDAIMDIQDEPFISDHQILDEAWVNWSPTLEEMDEEVPSGDAKAFMKALRTVVEARSTENAQNMADGLSPTSGVVDGLRRILRQQRLPKYCDPVIVKVFLAAQDLSKSSELDLSWMQLWPAQVSKIVRAALQEDSLKITSLDISGIPDVTLVTLSNIFRLEKAREITRLYVFGCPNVEDIRTEDMPCKIGMHKGAEMFNSYYPVDLFDPWKRPRFGKARSRV
ncbi:hypothetical protein FS837_011028 [Tulasnella sp. UAMH 9824]|nr:hypothetical protein FS837_011028 [Tulasnella sp. UAMH 9824]